MTLPTVAARPRRPATFHALRVSAVEPLCADAAVLTFDVPDRLVEAFTFRPGQCLTVRREIDGRDERRSYSICSPAGTAPRIGVRAVPGGRFSSWLVHGVRPGDVLRVMTPAGTFAPELTGADGLGHHVLVAAGSGITPMLSIAASVLAADEEARVTLLYGNRRTSTVMFADELADLKDRHPSRFQLVHVLSREPREAELLAGRLDTERLTALLGAHLDVQQVAHWWLCGPYSMVREARLLLAGLGVPADRVHQELFHADEETPTASAERTASSADLDGGTGVGPVSEVTVVFDGRATTFSAPRGRSILDGAQQARPDLPFACKGGVCGTCRALVADGRADMRRNYALEPAEVSAGYVLTCQTYAASDSLEVDFDS